MGVVVVVVVVVSEVKLKFISFLGNQLTSWLSILVIIYILYYTTSLQPQLLLLNPPQNPQNHQNRRRNNPPERNPANIHVIRRPRRRRNSHHLNPHQRIPEPPMKLVHPLPPLDTPQHALGEEILHHAQRSLQHDADVDDQAGDGVRGGEAGVVGRGVRAFVDLDDD